MLNLKATTRTSRVVVVTIALMAAVAAGTAISGQPLALRVLVSVLTFIAIGTLGLLLAPKRS
jgi:hypothetical protein